MFDLIPHRKGATNHVPSFIQQFGPIREVRFVKKPDGTPDGGVHQLFTIVGRFEAHQSPGGECGDANNDSRRFPCYGPSEANEVIKRFNQLSASDKQAILDFLRSL